MNLPNLFCIVHYPLLNSHCNNAVEWHLFAQKIVNHCSDCNQFQYFGNKHITFKTCAGNQLVCVNDVNCFHCRFVFKTMQTYEIYFTWPNLFWSFFQLHNLIRWHTFGIIPLRTATTKNELIELNHYTNLQPLCAYTNRCIKK